MQIDKYMVIRRYVFPIMFMDQEMPQVLIPDSFNIELIRNVLAEGNFASNFNVLRTQVNDAMLKLIKADYPLAEAFLTGKASGVNIEPV